MSRLDNLIAELCPNGVEYKNFGDIATIQASKKSATPTTS